MVVGEQPGDREFAIFRGGKVAAASSGAVPEVHLARGRLGCQAGESSYRGGADC